MPTAAKDIVGRIRDHIKKAPPRNDRFDLNEAIQEVIEMVQAPIDKNRVSVRTRLVEGVTSVRGDRVQLQQVVLNLILNAVEAMSSVEERRAKLSISTEQGRRAISWSQCKIQDPGLIRSISSGFSRPSTPRRRVESEWDFRFAGPSSPPMGVGCGQRPIDLGAQYFSSLCRQAWKIYEFSSCGFPDSRAERRQRSRWSSSTGLQR